MRWLKAPEPREFDLPFTKVALPFDAAKQVFDILFAKRLVRSFILFGWPKPLKTLTQVSV
jgi:hypothetical protein